MLKKLWSKVRDSIISCSFGIINASTLLLLVEKDIAPLNGPITLGMIGLFWLYSQIIHLILTMSRSGVHSEKLKQLDQITLIGLLGLVSWTIVATQSYGSYFTIFSLSMIQFIELSFFWFSIQYFKHFELPINP